MFAECGGALCAVQVQAAFCNASPFCLKDLTSRAKEHTTIRALMQLSDMRCGVRSDLELLSVYRDYPPREEQGQIVRYLDAKVGKINTRLISDVVTGKVDVRGIPVAEADILPEMEIDITLEDGAGNSDELVTET